MASSEREREFTSAKNQAHKNNDRPKELVMVRDGLMSVYGDRFSCADVRV